MFRTRFHRSNSKDQLNGEIISVRGSTYIARLIDQNGHLIETCRDRFQSVTAARQWLRTRGITELQLLQSSAYLEMINN